MTSPAPDRSWVQSEQPPPRRVVPWLDLALLLGVLLLTAAAVRAVALDDPAEGVVWALLALTAVQFGRE